MQNEIIDHIVAQTAVVFRTTPGALITSRRDRIITDARHMAMLIAQERGEYTPHIAIHFGVTPQAVRYGITMISHQMRLYPAFRGRYDRIVRALDGQPG